MNSYNLSDLLKYIELLDEGKYSIHEVLTNVPTIANEIELKELVKFIKQNEFISKAIDKYIVFANSKLCLYKYSEMKKTKEAKKYRSHMKSLGKNLQRKALEQN